MIPLRDDQPTNTFPLVTLLLIALNGLVYCKQVTTPGFDASFAMVPYEVTHHVDLNNFVGLLGRDGTVHLNVPPHNALEAGQYPPYISYGVSPHPLWLTVFTSMFMHSGLLHIGGNMLYLWIFGNNVEDVLGRARFLIFYLVCGVAAAAAQIGIDPNSLIPNVGASGAIAGVLGAYFILYPNARVLTIVPIFIAFLAEIRAYWILLLWIVLNIFQGVTGLGMPGAGGVAHFAHIGGFFAGIVLISLLGGRRLAARPLRRVQGY